MTGPTDPTPQRPLPGEWVAVGAMVVALIVAFVVALTW